MSLRTLSVAARRCVCREPSAVISRAYILQNGICDEGSKGNNLNRFPYQEGNVGNWFQEQALSKSHTTGNINMLNLRRIPRYPKLNGAVFPPSGAEGVKGFKMFYHGTAHEHAKSILKGIKLAESGDDGDFSCGKGFYVTNQFQNAVDRYACLRLPKAAVLGFKIPNDVLERFRKESLILTGEENKDKWRDVVQDIPNTLKKNYFFIEGPEIKRELDGRKTDEQLPDTHQMCILREEMAEAFDEHLDSVVFYNTSRRRSVMSTVIAIVEKLLNYFTFIFPCVELNAGCEGSQ